MTKYVLFDLDGTLTNPEEGIVNSIRFAAEFYGLKNVEELKPGFRKYIGPPLLDTFIELLGPDVEKAEAAVAHLIAKAGFIPLDKLVIKYPK